jgi:hypothetical protein
MKNKIRSTFLNILLISIGLTIFGFLADSDPPVSLSTTILEFIMMTIITFLLVSILYFGTTFTVKKVRQIFP